MSFSSLTASHTIWIYFIILASLLLLAKSNKWLKHSFNSGIASWSHWLPVAAALSFMSILAINLSSFDLGNLRSIVSLNTIFTAPEMIVLFLTGPMLLTRNANLIAFATLIYLLNAIVSHTTTSSQLGILILTMSITTIIILADKMPWNQELSYSSPAQKIRGAFLILMSYLGIATVLFALINLRQINMWLHNNFLISLPLSTLFLLFGVLFIGWIAIILGFHQTILILFLGLPSCVLLAFSTGWSIPIVAIPYTALVSLAFANTDRSFHLQKRRFQVLS